MANNKNYLKYFDLIYDINHGLMNTNDWAYKVVNSDDDRFYIYKNGKLYSDDNDNICFEEIYISVFTEIVLKRKNYPSEMVKIVFFFFYVD